MGLKEFKKALALESDISRSIKAIDAYFSNAKYLKSPRKFDSDLKSVVDFFGGVDEYGNSMSSTEDLILVGTLLVHAYVNTDYKNGDTIIDLVERFEDWPILYLSDKDPYNNIQIKRRMVELEAPETIFGQLRDFPGNMSIENRALLLWMVPDIVDSIFKTSGVYENIYLDSKRVFDNINAYVLKYKDSLDDETMFRVAYLFSINGNTYKVKDQYSSSINAETIDVTLNLLKYHELKQTIEARLPDVTRFDTMLGLSTVMPFTFEMWRSGLLDKSEPSGGTIEGLEF